MKLPLQIVIFGLLVWMGWNQPYRTHAHRMFPNAKFAKPTPDLKPKRPQARPIAAPTPSTSSTPKNNWLWDKGILDPQRTP